MENDEIISVDESEKKGFEWRAFIFIAIFLFPILSLILVGGYGFAIWMSQVFLLGPPGHG